MKQETTNIHGSERENIDGLLYEQLSEYIKGLEKKKRLPTKKILPTINVTDLTDEVCRSLGNLKSYLKSNHSKKH